MISKSKLNTKFAKDKGYKVLEDGTVISSQGKVLRLYCNKQYPYIYFGFRSLDGHTTKVYVHRLQAYQKFGDKLFEPGILVRHLNGNSFDNSFNNIDLGTASDNWLDIPEDKRREITEAAAQVSRKLTTAEVVALRQERQDGKSFSFLCKKYGLAKSTVSYIVNNKTYK